MTPIDEPVRNAPSFSLTVKRLSREFGFERRERLVQRVGSAQLLQRLGRCRGRDRHAFAAAAKDSQPGVDDLEIVGQRVGRLGFSQREVTPVAQTKGEDVQRALLEFLQKIDQHVAAER